MPLVFIACAAWYVTRLAPDTQVTLRVGADHSPPFYSIGKDGSITGLAVDVLNEAARRRKINLIWTPVQNMLIDTALETRVVQLWPLVGVTPDRKAKFYVSQPWLASEFILLSLQEHPVGNPEEAAGKVVSHARLTFTKIIADRYLARSKELVCQYREGAIQTVCRGEAGAALVESGVLNGVMLSRPAGCETAHFHISSLPGAVTPLAITAVPEVKIAAEALRAEIRVLTTDGFLSRKLDEWSPFSAAGMRSVWAEAEAVRLRDIYRSSLIVILMLAFGLALLAWRARHLRLAAEFANAGRRDAQRRFAAFMDTSPMMAFMKDAGGKMLYVNSALAQFMGKPREECLGKDDFELWPRGVAEVLRAADLQMLAENEPIQLVERIPVSALDIRDFLVVKFPFANEQGERFIGGTAIDITEREVALRGLAASEMRYRELFDKNPAPAYVFDRDSLTFLAVNIAATERYGWTREDFLSGMTLPDILAPETFEAPDGHLKRHRTKDGLLLNVDVTSYQLEYKGRQACLTMVRDLTELDRTLDQLRVSEERWQLALRGAGDALWDWDLQTDRIFRSQRWRSMLGYEEWEIGDSHVDFVALLHPDDIEPMLAALNAHLEKKTDSFSSEYRMRHKDTTWVWIMDRGQAIWDERGRPLRMAGSHTDITARKHLEDILSLQARTDALTGLPNRWEFEEVFGKTVRLARETETLLTVCVCDLDRFKDVNDTYGHATGDRVLIKFGEILRQHLRKSDLLARIGGDEFILAMPGTSAEEAGEVMERMRRQLSAHVFDADGTLFHASSSFGVAPLRATHENGAELIAEADRCLYKAKESGRNKTLVAA